MNNAIEKKGLPAKLLGFLITIITIIWAVFKDYVIYRGGQKMRSSVDLDLPQGVEATIQVVFSGVAMHYNQILKLGFTVGRDDFGFKNIAIR